MGVVNQQFALQLRVHCNVRDEIHQQSVIGHVVLQIGMRPIGTPQDTIGKCFHHMPSKRHNVLVSVLLALQSLGAADA